MNYVFNLFLPFVAFAQIITPSYIAPTTSLLEQVVVIPIIQTETPNIPISVPNTPILEATSSVYCSCVRATQEIYPDIPLMDAIEFKGNGTMENSEIVILQYKSKKSDEYIYQIF